MKTKSKLISKSDTKIGTMSCPLCNGEGYDRQFNERLRIIFDDIEHRAEAKMLLTGKLEGMHYAALTEVRREMGLERSKQ